MPYVLNEGCRLYWTSQGSGDPILLIMGLTFTHEMWYRLLPVLAARRRVILFDNRGVGRSETPRGVYTIQRMARDAAAVLAEAGETSADVLGASMGGMIAQELALQRPELVRRLVLACTSHGGISARWPRFVPPKTMPWTDFNPRKHHRALRHWLYAPGTPMERIKEDWGVEVACERRFRGFVSQFSGILMWTSFSRLPLLRAPTLVTHGAFDRLIPPENGRVVAARIPGARFEMIPDAGHMLMTDQPERCAELLESFLG